MYTYIIPTFIECYIYIYLLYIIFKCKQNKNMLVCSNFYKNVPLDKNNQINTSTEI